MLHVIVYSQEKPPARAPVVDDVSGIVRVPNSIESFYTYLHQYQLITATQVMLDACQWIKGKLCSVAKVITSYGIVIEFECDLLVCYGSTALF
jgi:hypothetical protein